MHIHTHMCMYLLLFLSLSCSLSLSLSHTLSHTRSGRRFGTDSGKEARPARSSEEVPVVALKEHLWSLHFSEYGQGVTMFRSGADRELIKKGVPEGLRAQVWILCVCVCVCMCVWDMD